MPMTAWTDYRGQARGLRGRGCRRAAGQSVQQAPGAPARSSHRTRGRVILPRPKAPPGHAHGARRATFWPGPPAARTIYRQTARREEAQNRARGRLPPRKCWEYAGNGSCAGHMAHIHLKRPYIPPGGPSSRPCKVGCNDTIPNRRSGCNTHTPLRREDPIIVCFIQSVIRCWGKRSVERC